MEVIIPHSWGGRFATESRKQQLGSKWKTISRYGRKRSMMNHRGSREHCFMWTTAVDWSFEIKDHQNKTITYKMNVINFPMPPILLPHFFKSQHMIRQSPINGSLQFLWQFLHQAFQVNNFIYFIKFWKRITEAMAVGVIWEFILFHTLCRPKGSNRNFPKKIKINTVERSWNFVFFFSEAKDKDPSVEWVKYFVQMGTRDLEWKDPAWKAGLWSLPTLTLGQVHKTSLRLGCFKTGDNSLCHTVGPMIQWDNKRQSAL